MSIAAIAAAVVAAFLASAPPVDAGVDQAVDDQRAAQEEGVAPTPRMRSTSNLSSVELRHLHIVIDRKGDRILVTEVLTLGTSGDSIFQGKSGYRIPLPSRAIGPRLSGDKATSLSTKIEEDGFRVVEPIVPGGGNVTVQFDVPIIDGAVSFEQRFASPIEVGQVICTWTMGEAKLEVAGMGKARKAELENGLTALVSMGKNVGARVSVNVTGLEGEGERWRWLVFVVTALLFLAGLAGWIAGRKRAGHPQGSGE